MRQTTTSNITIQYPDAVGFAFLPCIIKASGSGVASIEATISRESKTYTYSVEAFADNCIMDYREYVQALFDGISFGNIDYSRESQKSNLGAVFDVSVKVKNSEGSDLATFSYTTFYVWGAMRAGETWNGHKKLTWFTHFPFSFGFYLNTDSQILVGYEGAPNKLVKPGIAGIVDINTSVLPNKARYWNIYDYDGEIQQGTFDNTFDLTFRLTTGGKQSLLLRIDRDDAESGIYLRWIDRHGFIRYWLFAAGEETREIASDLSFIRNNLADYLYGYYGDNGRRQGYERTDSIKLCAPLVDSDTFDMLQDLASSPVVDMYLGGDWKQEEDMWMSVTIKAGSYTKSTACLQDFVCNLVINNTQIQQL